MLFRSGSPNSIGNQLAAKYPFVTYLGYLDNNALETEAATWTCFINPVFYYSRGVSTKLAKALSWGLPVVTTTIGCRGYVWTMGSLNIADTAMEMAIAIQTLSNDSLFIANSDKQIRELVSSIPKLSENENHLRAFISQVS